MNIQYDNIGNYKKSKNNKRKKYKRYKTPSYKKGFKDKVEEQFNVSDSDRERLKLYSEKVQDKYKKLVKKGNRRIKLGAAGIALGGSALLYALANRRKKRKFLGIRY